MNFEEALHRHRSELERLWTQRLIVEYENICFAHRIKLRRPVIQVMPESKRLGLWSAETRTLSLAAPLLQGYGWEVVVEILKHEMAHQIVTDIFESEDGHGADFSRACQMLGVAKWAQSATGDIPEGIGSWKDSQLEESDERLLRRVEKLLQLATSSNEHEAHLAMQKVQELYAKYNLERLQARRISEHVYLLIHHRSKRIPRHQAVICSLLNDFFFVKIIYTTLYDTKDLCDYKAVELLGTRENVLMAEYVYHFLWNRLQWLWEAYRRDERQGPQSSGRRQRSSFFGGVLAGFRDKLEENERRQAAAAPSGARSSKALVKLEDAALETFVGTRYPRLVNVRRGATSYDADSYHAGRAEGLKLVLHKGLHGQDGNRGRLLR